MSYCIDLESVLKQKLEETSGLLKKVMPEAFFRDHSSCTAAAAVTLACGISGKTGIQTIELPDSYLAVYIKPAAGTLISARAVAGDFSAFTSYESSPINDRGEILMIDVFKKAAAKSADPAFTEEALSEVYCKLYGTLPGNFAGTFKSLVWSEVSGLDAETLAGMFKDICDVRQHEYSRSMIKKSASGHTLMVTLPDLAVSNTYIVQVLEQLQRSGYRAVSGNIRKLVSAGCSCDFDSKAVTVLTFELLSDTGIAPEKLVREINELIFGAQSDILAEELLFTGKMDCAAVNLLRAAGEFAAYQLSFVDRNAYTLCAVKQFMATYPEILSKLVFAFESKFSPCTCKCSFTDQISAIREEIANINSGLAEKDAKVKAALGAVCDFISNILKTNYYSDSKTALSFGVDPKFMAYYENLSESYIKAFPPERPFGVFFFWHKNISGFQIRFSEIARGGWRTVVPKAARNRLESADMFEQSRCELFREGFVLANTQHKKNKDIYEGGSKMVTLLKLPGIQDFKTELWAAQRAVFESFLQLITYDDCGKLKDLKIVDYTNRTDIIEIGPDENMFDQMISWMGDRAKASGYTLGAGIISGKEDTGINHKHYGVTSFGVYQYFLRTLEYLQIPKDSDFSVKLSGGPFGDVAGNMIKMLNLQNADGTYVLPGLRIIAVTDGPAALYDPAGIDRKELSRLVHAANLDSFDPALLKGEGAFMIFNLPDDAGLYPMVSIKNGKSVREMIPRNVFMKMFQNNICHPADIFVPCGGRPQTINISNYTDYAPDGVPSSRAIVEGANSFITPDARAALQKMGIVIVKDSSANKCGVITSSYEIMSGLLLDAEEFISIREELVAEVMEKLASCAQREADWLFREFEYNPQLMMTELSDRLADSINEHKDSLYQLFDLHPELISDEVLFSHLPALFKTRYPERISRIPDTYRKAIAAVECALRIVFRPHLTLTEEVACINALLNQ